MMMSIGTIQFVGAIVVASVIAFASPHARADEAKVAIDNFTFNPKELRVTAGTTVTWTNRDDIPHTVVDPQKFRSKPLDTDGAFSFTFTTPGTYTYFCSLHPHMTGVIVVEAVAGERAAQ
jgi:plastocyanin